MNAPEFQSSRKFADTPFGRIAYVERGSGPVALFVHGFPLCGYQWRHALDELSPVRTCIAPDMMGLGYSEIPSSQDISFESQAKMLAAFLQARSIRQVDVVANDTGASVSQVFLLSYPDHARSVTFTNCEVSDLWPNAMLEQFFIALKTGMMGELLRNIVRDPLGRSAPGHRIRVSGKREQRIARSKFPSLCRVRGTPRAAQGLR